MSGIKRYLNLKKRQKVINYLKTSDPNSMVKMSEQKLLKTLHRVSKKVPFYKQKANYVKATKNVKSIEDFKQYVPIIDKREVFNGTDLRHLCLNGAIDDIKSVFSSSGYSGLYSFGVNTIKNYRNISESIDTSIEYLFNVSKKKTFMISCIAMGVKVHTSLPIAEISVRDDIAIAIIKKYAIYFDQLLIVGDPYFIKKIVEVGIENNIDWSSYNTSFIFGEDWFSDSLRNYIEKISGISFTTERVVVSTMGVAELDLNLFHESRYTIAIRREAQKNEELRKELFGNDIISTPILFHYFPHRTYMECINEELVFSMLSRNLKIPLIRYNSKDWGKLFSYQQMEKILTKYGVVKFLPDIKLPFVAVYGRKGDYINYKNHKIYTQIIKQSIFEDIQVAKSVTGYFRLNNDNNKTPIELQLNRDIELTPNLENKIDFFINKYLPVKLPVKIYPYISFPYSMELDYERKFKFI